MSRASDDGAPRGEVILYRTADGAVRAEVHHEGETLWMSQREIGALFGVDVRTVNEHLRNIYRAGELVEVATIRNFRLVRSEGNREVSREISHHKRDATCRLGPSTSSPSC